MTLKAKGPAFPPESIRFVIAIGKAAMQELEQTRVRQEACIRAGIMGLSIRDQGSSNKDEGFEVGRTNRRMYSGHRHGLFLGQMVLPCALVVTARFSQA